MDSSSDLKYAFYIKSILMVINDPSILVYDYLLIVYKCIYRYTYIYIYIYIYIYHECMYACPLVNQ